MVLFDGIGSGDALHFSRAIPQDDEGCFPKDTHAAHPAAESNFFVHKIRKEFDEYAVTGCGHPAKASSKESFAGAEIAAVPSSVRSKAGAQFALFRSVAFPPPKADWISVSFSRGPLRGVCPLHRVPSFLPFGSTRTQTAISE